MVARSTKVLRMFAGKGAWIFNDKLVNGRSYKVMGWSDSDYNEVCERMREVGLKAKVVKAREYYDHRGGRMVQNTRLHVVNG